VRESFLPFAPPSLGAEELAEVVDTLSSGWITTGPKTKSFEIAFAERVGAPVALGLNSCTSALHTALKALGVGPGDRVATSPMTFCSTVNVIEHTGAQPVLVDVDPATLNLDPALLAAAAAGDTLRAVMPVHFAGHPCEMDPILEVAGRHGLAVIEDAAHALPASYRGRTVGETTARPEVQRAVAFSFYATKNLTTAEGGMLTGSPELVEAARMWSLHGMSKDAWKRYSDKGSWFYEVVAPGFKYNMTDIAAALGLRQLERLDTFDLRRQEIARQYTEALSDCPAVETPTSQPDVHHAWHLYVLRLNLAELCIDRAEFISQLQARNIGVSVHFIPIHLHPYYRDRYGWRPEDLPVAFEQFQRTVSLPIYPRMSDGDIADVVAAVKEVTSLHRKKVG
jgi:dTDP-4-amino-4,6-dideoxygalactose transaminase